MLMIFDTEGYVVKYESHATESVLTIMELFNHHTHHLASAVEMQQSFTAMVSVVSANDEFIST